MRKNFIANIGFLLLLNLLVKPFWILGIDRSVQNEIGPQAYGIYFALFNFAYLFQVILDFGINNYNNRLIAQQPERLGTYLFSTLLVKIMLSVAYTIIVFVTAFGVNFSLEQLSMLWLLAIMQILMSFYSFFRSNLNALQLFKTDAVLSILDKLLTSIICGILLWTSVFSVAITATTFIYAQIAGYSMAVGIAIIILGRQRIVFKWNIDKKLIAEIFKKSYPYALLGFLMTAYYRIDGVLIERMLGDEGAYEAGIYASAFRLLDALGILGFLFAGLLMPMFTRMLEDKNPIAPLLDMSYRLMLVFAVSSGIGFIFYRNEIMAMLYDSGSAYTGSIFGWLMVSFICISLTYIYGSLLTAGGRISLLNRISLAGFAINVVLNILLIPEYKALGAAMATVAAQLLVLIAHVIMARKQFGLERNGKWLHSIVFIGLVTAIHLSLSLLNLNWIYQLLIGGTLSIIAIIPSGIVKLSEIRSFIGIVRDAVAKKSTLS